MIYTEVINKIRDTLKAVPQVAEVHASPQGRDADITQYPAVIFIPDSIENSFSDTGSNFRLMRFKLWVIVNANNIKSTDLFERILPNVVDGVITAFDKGWDFQRINNYRTWAKIDGGVWGLSQESKSVEAYAELNLVIKLSTDIS